MSNLIAIAGGNLQGVEAAYLAKKAGWEVLLIDKNPQAAASLMCDRFLPFCILNEWALETGIPLAFDMEAYAITSSKLKSNQIFQEINLNAPKPWPQCDFPIVVKPDGKSGSRDVRIIHNENELASYLPTTAALSRMVAQEYLEGPSYSIEIIGFPSHYTPLQVTELHMDRDYDCKRVLAPCGLDSKRVMEFEQMAIRIAERIQLKGLMDLEVILHEGQLKLLEIDARLPSQTPTVVFQSTGTNMVKLLGELFLTGKMHVNHTPPPQAAIYEHIKVLKDHIAVRGEHIMSGIGPLQLSQGLFGADEAITNFHPDLNEWVATLILKGRSMKEVLDKQQQIYRNIREKAG